MAIEIAPPEPVSDEFRKRRRDIGAGWRLTAWGAAAAIALAALAIITQTEAGSARLQEAFYSRVIPSPLVAEIADLKRRSLEKEAETKRLETLVISLATDRDRLTTRLSSLETTLDDVTGSIKKQAALTAPPSTAPKTPPPVIAPAASTEIKPGEPSSVVTQNVPMPPVRMAAAPSGESATETARKAEFAVDLGGASSLDVLGARWAAVKANFGPLLNGLSPLAAHDSRPGSTGYRLIVGPVANPAAAMQLCNKFAAARITCRSAKFDGDQLAQR